MEAAYQGADRRAEGTDDWRAKTSADIKKLQADQAQMSQDIADNTAMTTQIKKNTDSLVEVAKAVEGAITVGKWLGTGAKYLAYIAGGITAIAGAVAVVQNYTPGTAQAQTPAKSGEEPKK
jgi:hypothetical protein